MKNRLLFIDTETGGLDPLKHSLLSVGMVVWENMNIIASEEIMINDGVLSVTPEALAINGLDTEQIRQTGVTPAIATERIVAFTGKHFEGYGKITLAGHNVHFDAGFIARLLAGCNRNLHDLFSHRMVDTSSILHYLYLSGQIKHKAVSSDDAFELFGIKAEGRHTALGDAIATAKLFNELLNLVKQ